MQELLAWFLDAYFYSDFFANISDITISIKCKFSLIVAEPWEVGEGMLLYWTKLLYIPAYFNAGYAGAYCVACQSDALGSCLLLQKGD